MHEISPFPASMEPVVTRTHQVRKITRDCEEEKARCVHGLYASNKLFVQREFLVKTTLYEDHLVP